MRKYLFCAPFIVALLALLGPSPAQAAVCMDCPVWDSSGCRFATCSSYMGCAECHYSGDNCGGVTLIGCDEPPIEMMDEGWARFQAFLESKQGDVKASQAPPLPATQDASAATLADRSYPQ